MDDHERYADPVDAGCAQAEEWLADKLAEAKRQMDSARTEYGKNCKYCGDPMEADMIGKSHYCTVDCAKDHERLKSAQARNGSIE